MPLGFIMALAGFEATPAEEMVRDEPARGGDDDLRALIKDWVTENGGQEAVAALFAEDRLLDPIKAALKSVGERGVVWSLTGLDADEKEALRQALIGKWEVSEDATPLY